MTDDHYHKAAADGGLTGDKRGMQTPELACMAAHKKTRTVQKVRENASFSEVVGLLECAQIAEEGLEPPTCGL